MLLLGYTTGSKQNHDAIPWIYNVNIEFHTNTFEVWDWQTPGSRGTCVLMCINAEKL